MRNQIALSLLLLAAPLHAQPTPGPDDIAASSLRVSPGACAAGSHTAEGPERSDLTKRQSRFYCDSMVSSMVDNQPGHFLVQFLSKGMQHAPILAFGGFFGRDGLLHVSSIYFEQGIRTPADDGFCQFFRGKSGKLTAAACGGVVVKDGVKSVAIVDFRIAP